MTTGIPRPPFRIIAPRGAPIKKKIKQAADNVNFLHHSISYRLILLSVISLLILFDIILVLTSLLNDIASLISVDLSDNDMDWKILSKFNLRTGLFLIESGKGVAGYLFTGLYLNNWLLTMDL